MISAIVAENVAHARAMIRWLDLPEDEWIPLAYGASVEHLLFKDVFVVRPHEGVREEHGDWFVTEIMSRTAGTIGTLPKGWLPEREPAVQPKSVQAASLG